MGRRKDRRKDLRDAVINYAVEVVDIPVAQELESTPKSNRVESIGGYAGKLGGAHAISPRKSNLG